MNSVQLHRYRKKNGNPVPIPEHIKPKCLCGVCRLCARRENSRRFRKNRKLGIPTRKYVTEAELDRRMSGKTI